MDDTWPDESQIDYDYYILSDDSLGRVSYDPTTESHIEGQVMDDTGHWHDCPFMDVLDDGVEVTQREADDVAREFGGELV